MFFEHSVLLYELFAVYGRTEGVKVSCMIKILIIVLPRIFPRENVSHTYYTTLIYSETFTGNTHVRVD